MVYFCRKRGQILILFVTGFLILVYIFSSTLVEHEEYMKNKEQIGLRMRKRKADVDVLCYNRVNVTFDTVKLKHVVRKMFVDVKHGVSWCPVFKAASSVWMKGFSQLGGKLNEKLLRLIEKGAVQWNMVARKAYPVKQDTNTTYANLNKTVRFLIIRHPFERVLSAYRDKLEHKEGREYYFRRYGLHIKRVYRQHWQDKEEPTFEEFLSFLAKNMIFDEHWKPITEQCAPCTIQYDYIIKTESLTEENTYMVEQLHLDKLVDIKLAENVNPAGRTDIKISKMYYSTVPRSLLEQIYKLYRDDFILFDYSPDEYFVMTK